MNFLVVLIVNDVNHCTPILDAWESAGVRGVTILPSSGLGRIRRGSLRDDLPLLPNLHDFLASEEQPSQTLFSVVDNQELVDRMIDLAQEIIGDLDNPNTGFLFVMPVLQAFGMGRHRQDRRGE